MRTTKKWINAMSKNKLPRKIFKKGNASLRILNSGEFVVYDEEVEIWRDYEFDEAIKEFCYILAQYDNELCFSNRVSRCSACWLGCGYVR